MMNQKNVIITSRPSLGGLEVTTIVIGAMSMLIFGCAIGFTIGYVGSAYGYASYWFGSFVLIPANVGMLYATCRVIFIITAKTFPDAPGHHDLHKNAARLLAFTIVTFSEWVASLVWYIEDHSVYYNEAITVLFACGFSFIMGIIMTGLAGGLHSQLSPSVIMNSEVPYPPQHSSHYNQGYNYSPESPQQRSSYPQRIPLHSY